MMKTVTMRLENANAELRVGDSNGIVIINNNNLVSIDELKEILSMFNYLNNSATSIMPLGNPKGFVLGSFIMDS